jgi:hypothetical protein
MEPVIDWFPDKEDTSQYDASYSNNPGEPRLGSLNPRLSGGSRSLCSGDGPSGSAQSDPGAGPICPRPLRDV